MVEFKEVGNIVILNPFCKSPVPEPNSVQLSSKIPDSICFDINYINIILVEQAIGNQLLISEIKNVPTEELKKNLTAIADVPV